MTETTRVTLKHKIMIGKYILLKLKIEPILGNLVFSQNLIQNRKRNEDVAQCEDSEFIERQRQ